MAENCSKRLDKEESEREMSYHNFIGLFFVDRATLSAPHKSVRTTSKMPLLVGAETGAEAATAHVSGEAGHGEN